MLDPLNSDKMSKNDFDCSFQEINKLLSQQCVLITRWITIWTTTLTKNVDLIDYEVYNRRVILSSKCTSSVFTSLSLSSASHMKHRQNAPECTKVLVRYYQMTHQSFKTHRRNELGRLVIDRRLTNRIVYGVYWPKTKRRSNSSRLTISQLLTGGL